uniref:Uncharacterized protein n=1 Tax=Lepeophtheirus salmonis TaxID=72036 RepID=A0A0K2V635_LEPSM
MKKKKNRVTQGNCCKVIRVVSPCRTESRIGDRHWSNYSKCPCLYPYLFPLLSQLILADLMKRQDS